MDGREIEPRKTVWAVAEVCWQEPDGTDACAPATLEDTSNSGACVRVKRSFAIGSRVMIKWRREQFSAIARNCRPDGRDYLLGLRREGTTSPNKPQQKAPNLPPLPTAAKTPPSKTEPATVSAAPSTSARRKGPGVPHSR